jgi:hypothetical protein
MVRCIVRDILPKYLVYRSVIQAVNGTMGNLDQPPHRKRVIASVEKDVWLNFPRLSLERLVVTLQATALKGKGATCDNVKVQLMLFYRYFFIDVLLQCQKIDSKNNSRKCGSCSTFLYCSKECQVTSWKEGGHKTMCKLRQRERLGAFVTCSHGLCLLIQLQRENINLF